MAAAFS
jgi:DNA-binding transcriptional regulator YiaG